MAWGAVPVTAAALLGAVTTMSAQNTGSEGPSVLLSVELPDRPTAGAQLFAEKQCIRCHSLADTDDRVGPDLGRILFEGSVVDLAGDFWNHSPVMREKMQDLKIKPAMITPSEMANLVAFLTAYRYYLTSLGDPGNPVVGEQIFREKRCAQCHEQSGGSLTQLGPDLARYRGGASALFLAQAMWNHGAEMGRAMANLGAAWPTFRDTEMGDLLAYLRAGAVGAGLDPVYFEPGSPRRGRDIFFGKSCSTCHAIGGRGGRGGPDLGSGGTEFVHSVAEIAGLMWNHSPAMTAEFQRRGIERVTFSGQEMVDIIAYLYFVNYAVVEGTPTRGAVLFLDKCGACHSVGSGYRVGPDLSTVEGLDGPLAVIAAMWNHGASMEQELQDRGLPWPRFERGQAADIIAFLLANRKPVEQ
jgi:cytochrome c2